MLRALSVLLVAVGGVLFLGACGATGSPPGADTGEARSATLLPDPDEPSGSGVGEIGDTASPPTTSKSPALPTDEPILPPLPADASGSGIWGLIVVGPQCAAQRDGEACPPVTSSAEVVAKIASGPVDPKGVPAPGGREVGKVRAGDDGLFLLNLPGGEFVLEVDADRARMCDPVPVSVPADGWAEVTIMCDSGIR